MTLFLYCLPLQLAIFACVYFPRKIVISMFNSLPSFYVVFVGIYVTVITAIYVKLFPMELTRHRAITCSRWHFAFGAMLSLQRNPCTDCKSPNSAQLGDTPCHSPKLHQDPYSSVRMRLQTDTQTAVTTIHFASSTTHAKCNNGRENK